MKYKVYWIAFMLLSFTKLALSQTDFSNVEDMSVFLDRMNQIAETTETIQCAFSQEKQLSFMDKKMISKGNMYFSGMDKLRWEYNEPYNYAVLMVSDELVIIDEGKVNQTKLGKNPAFKKVQQLMTSTFKGDFHGQKESFTQSLEENEKFFRMTLVPKDQAMQEFITKMEVYFTKSDFMISHFVMDENGDITKTLFSEQKINEQLPKEIFRW